MTYFENQMARNEQEKRERVCLGYEEFAKRAEPKDRKSELLNYKNHLLNQISQKEDSK